MTRVLYPCLCIDLINIDRVHFHFLPLNDDNDEGENDEDNVDEDDDNDDNDQYGDDDDDGGFDDKGCDRGVCLHSVNKRRALSLLSTQCFAVGQKFEIVENEENLNFVTSLSKKFQT